MYRSTLLILAFVAALANGSATARADVPPAAGAVAISQTVVTDLPDSAFNTPLPAAVPRDQTQPAIAFNGHPQVQNFLLVWVEDRGFGADIYAKRLFVNGLPQGGAAQRGWKVVRDDYEVTRRSPPPGRRADPALVWKGDEFLLVYSELGDEANGWDVYIVRLSAAGYAQGRPRRLAGGPGHQRRPDIAALNRDPASSTDYLVVWEDNARDIDEIWGMQVHANGIPRGPAYPLLRGMSNASDPTTNGSLLSWVDDRNGQADIFSIRLRNGVPTGQASPVAQDVLEEFNPRFGSSGLLWNVFDPATGIDVMGIEIIENSRSPAGPGVIVVPAADQVSPDMDNGVLVFADNRSGDFDLYAVRVLTGGRIRARGHDYQVLTDR